MKKEKLTIVKIGGKVVDDEDKLNKVLVQFAAFPGLKLLVHGGGKLASDISESMGLKPQMVEGRRVTDAKTLKIVQMVYAGLINTKIIAKLQALKCNSVGMHGADGNTLLAVKRPIKDIDYGYVGDVVQVNSKTIQLMLTNNLAPVFCALTHDGRGQILNTNADTITSELACALAESFDVDLVFCFEMNGVLSDPENASSVIPEIDAENYQKLKDEKIITDGMIPKIDNAFMALDKGVSNVFITHYTKLKMQLISSQTGTRIHK